jgi:predicted membrane-bound spermidine synthase
LLLAGGREGETTKRLGLVYAVNTVCAVAGSLATGFLAIPWLGLQRTLFIATGALIMSSLLLTVFGRLSIRIRAMLACPAIGSWSGLSFSLRDRDLLASGV